MIALLFATYEEAQSLLNRTKATPLVELPGCYHSAFGIIVITGIGPFAAACVVHRLLSKFPIKTLYNFGLAGALSSSFQRGSLHKISRVSKEQWHPKGNAYASKSFAANVCTDIKFAGREFTEVQGVRLLSCDKPLYESAYSHYDLVDMEGYAIAWQAAQYNIPCHLYKLVSDYCSQESPMLIRNNLKTYSDLIAAQIPALCRQ